MENPRRLDYFGVGLFALALFGIVLSVGGPLTLHEGVLSQTTKAMLADHDWTVPHFGVAPWLERPPLPQWISCAIAAILGTDEWVLRLGPALAASITVLLTMWLAGRLFGRATGILSGLILATMYNFTRYATLAEADMFLAPIVAATLCVFAYLEILRPASESAKDSVNFLGRRPWLVALFFGLLGATNLAKGLVFGTVMALAPIGTFLLWNFSWRRIGRYTWLWGWLIFALVGGAWPALVLQRYPDAPELWAYDLFGRLNGHYLEEPRWYYFGCLLWVMLPWTVPAVIGLALTWTKLWRQGEAKERLVLCWAWMPPLVFSLAQGKHHHYMIHFLAPWAILATHGILWIWQKAVSGAAKWWPVPIGLSIGADCLIGFLGRDVPGPSWLVPALLLVAPAVLTSWWYFAKHPILRVSATGTMALVFVVYCAGFAYKGEYLHRSLYDTAFLHQVRERLSPEDALLVYVGEDSLEGLRVQYYLGKPLFFLHNISFIHDQRILSADVFLVARYRSLEEIEKYGRATTMLQCEKSRREESAADRWTLFRLHLRDDLERKNADVRISPMQAIYRTPGPDLN
jgi:4-amino-4-deoxy-L-arabinose transferase-like glycosyltransferase